MSDAPAPHECPAGLVDLIRLPVIETHASGPTGISEPTDVARLVAFLDSHGDFDAEPDWFNALNQSFQYQLTAVGAPGPGLFIKEKVHGNQFKIAGGAAGLEVSWQVTGVRHDAWANAHRTPVEEAKPEGEVGTYLHPELFGAGEDKRIASGKRPTPKKQADPVLAAPLIEANAASQQSGGKK